MVARWKLYLAQRDDKRLPHEKWRANTFVPWPFITMEAKVAAMCEIMNSVDPPIQAEGIGPEDEGPAVKMQHVHTYSLLKNKWLLQQDLNYRDMCVQGTAPWKIVWENRSRRVRIHPTDDAIRAFEEAIDDAVKRGLSSKVPTDPEEFEKWRETVNRARIYGQIPELPWVAGNEQEITDYRGPALERPFIGDLRFDPMVEDPQKQELFIHRIVKSKRWLMERTGPGADKKFDPRQVAAALEHTPESRFSEWDDEIAGMLGIPRTQDDPLHEHAVELWECWEPETKAPYKVILNRKAIVNKTPDVHPFFHGKTPFLFTRNIALSRRALGISDLQITDKLAKETNTLHDLLLDAVLLSVIPVFIKKRGSGIAEAQRFLRPGGFIEADSADAIQTLTKFQPGIEQAIRMIMSLQSLQDETSSTQPSVRGAQANIGRVSASEFQGRLNQALVRTKQQMLRIETEHDEIPAQFAFLWYQFGPKEIKVRIGGEDVPADPFVTMRRQDFQEVLAMDFRFRGATRTLNRELSAQMLDGFLKTATSAQALTPIEVRGVLKKIYEIQGHKGVGAVITTQGTADLAATWEFQMLQTRAQLAAAKQQAQLQQFGNTPPPNEIPLGDAPVGEPAGGPIVPAAAETSVEDLVQ